ncbi:MAG TPA: hypothetical protein VHI95_16680 [Acidimicrobiales bacterium]|nr:hypothetical protein [Acidimicrobiales bacterium]
MTTRDSLHMLACYVVAPARKARTGRIGLRPTGEGFGTPPFDDGSRIVVRGDRLAVDPGEEVAITTLRAGASFLGVELSSDPGVGTELPPFRPDRDLQVDVNASHAVGKWYRIGQSVLDQLSGRLGERAAKISEAQLWPEHFDLAVTVESARAKKVNVGVSPGDSFVDEPYVYVGPQDLDGLDGGYWNAPFGAFLTYSSMEEDEQAASALDFIDRGFALL